jgi:amino acid transporter
LSSGKAIFLAGPGVAVIAYLVVGTIFWYVRNYPLVLLIESHTRRAVMASMGEMTALFPVKGPTFEFTRRFVDESVGIASGWITWLASSFRRDRTKS